MFIKRIDDIIDYSTEHELIDVIKQQRTEGSNGLYIWLQPYGNDVHEPCIGVNSFFVSSEDSCYPIDKEIDAKTLAQEMIFAYNNQYKTNIS